MKTKPILPPAYLFTALLAMLALHFAFPGLRIIPVPWNLLGLLPLGFGAWVNLMADQALKRASTTVRPFEESAALVTTGVYHLSRHPMYLGFLALAAGAAMLLGSLTPWIVLPVLWAVLGRVFIGVEERMLSARFGSSWEAYVRQVGRWL